MANPLDVAREMRLYRALRHFWHPVMYSSEPTDQPRQVFLLDEQLVLIRLGGAVRCFADLCVHRGTPLSRGWQELGKQFELKVYSGVGHAFALPDGGHYDPAAAADCWEESVRFLDRYLRAEQPVRATASGAAASAAR